MGHWRRYHEFAENRRKEPVLPVGKYYYDANMFVRNSLIRYPRRKAGVEICSFFSLPSGFFTSL